MIPYEDFIVPSKWWEYVLKEKHAKFINNFYKKNGTYPLDEEIKKIVLSNDETESFKRVFYARYCANGIIPPSDMLEPEVPNIPQEPIIPETPPAIDDEEIIDIPNNELWYTTYNDEMLIPSSLKNGKTSEGIFGAALLRNIYENGIGKLIFDNEITQVGLSAFANDSNLKSITIPNTVISIGTNNGYGAFSNSGLEKFICNPQKSQLKTVHYSFKNCNKLHEIILSDICENLESAFDGCLELETITIPQNCVDISGTFPNCPKLKTIICKAMIAPITNTDTFGNYNGWYTERCTGRETYQDNINTLFIHKEAVGYTEGIWATRLLDEGQCGFHIEYLE